ncbi:hypothetical protein [Actinoplanes sp. M2I2]|uniref:hypothetical protein n=1 Tax=Actinoplanes sp. M2I2 TaxID=1734444 RepID=UPI00201FC02B|nr:hypothetical protein [Actinoplanes sp. M2I2]
MRQRWLRVFGLGAAASLLGGAAGCSADEREAVASAKCSVPVAEEAGFDDWFDKRDTTVTGLGEGRYRVTGVMLSRPEVARSVDFVCEVAPDPSDQLRGFKVTLLEVTPIN